MKVIHTYSFMKKLLKKVTTPPTPYDKLQKAEQASINYDGISNPVIYDDETSEHIPAIKKIYLTNASFSQIRYEKDAKKNKEPLSKRFTNRNALGRQHCLNRVQTARPGPTRYRFRTKYALTR